MQFTTITTVLFGLLATQALACGTPGDQCNSPGSTACQCNGGQLVSCEARGEGQPGYAWRFYGNCAPNGGGLTCVNGACVIQ